jgi:hypothetical protein
MASTGTIGILGALVALAGCSNGSNGNAGDDPDVTSDVDVAPDVDGGDADVGGEADFAPDLDVEPDDLAEPDGGIDDDGATDVLPHVACDDGLAIDSADPLAAAHAIGFCDESVSARWVLPDGSTPPAGSGFDVGHGILPDFGPNVAPREGASLLALSSGTARRPTDPGYQSAFDKGYMGPAPVGFPRESPFCPGVTAGEAHDGIGLEVTVQVPPGATGFAFDSSFYTRDFPDYVCSTYNDFFLALLSPIPMGLTDGDIVFDGSGDPISVNTPFLQACTCSAGPPCPAGGISFDCPLGIAVLQGTGFDDPVPSFSGAATGWLETRVPASAGTNIQLRFVIYDSGDGTLDSTALVDNFRWLTEPGVTMSTTPVP